MGTNRFQELAAGCGKVMPYFILGITSTATGQSVINNIQGKARGGKTLRVTEFLDPAGDLTFVVLNSFVKPSVSANLGAKLTLIAAGGSAISSLAKLTHITYRHWSQKHDK